MVKTEQLWSKPNSYGQNLKVMVKTEQFGIFKINILNFDSVW